MKINRVVMRRTLALLGLASGIVVGISACGGGGASTASGSAPVVSAAAAGTTSSGVITAFGSVFVGGHEFGTGRARFIDDDTGVSSASSTGLEVGMVVDIKPTDDSSATKPEADELHIHPLARGFVDASDTVAGTLTVMGQTIQLTSSTNFSDRRACATAVAATCTPVSTAAGLTSTADAANPGSYVAVHGYLYSGTSGSANIVATLVSVADTPTVPSIAEASSGAKRANFKAEGLVTVGSSSITVGGLTLDLSTAKCFVAKAQTACASAFTTGQVIAVGSALAPVAPTTILVADFARLASKTSVDSSGSAVELEGVVSSASASSFVVRGVTIDASGAATGTVLPAVGDVVRVLGTVASSGQTVTASSVVILHTATSSKLGLEGDASAIAAGTSANTYTFSVLGQTVTVNAQTRLMDRSTHGWDKRDPAANPFNITTFATYMASKAPAHVIVKAETNSAGNLVASSVSIVKASAVAAVAGLVDSAPAVFNSPATGTASTFSVHGIAISADPAAVRVPSRSPATIVAGDKVTALGSWNGTVLTIGATLSSSNQVFDSGVPRTENRDRGDF